jgi:hypothetical protein
MCRARMSKLGISAVLLILVLAPAPTVHAQSITGRLSGTLTDPSGAAIPGAPVQLTYELTQTTRTFSTDANGSFMFTVARKL